MIGRNMQFSGDQFLMQHSDFSKSVRPTDLAVGGVFLFYWKCVELGRACQRLDCASP